MQVIKEVFDKLDSGNEDIVIRAEYLLKLRNDNRVNDFINVDAVRLGNQIFKLN